MRRPSIVRTTGLVIVVSGLNVRDKESEDPTVSDGVGVIDGLWEDVEGSCELDELLSRETVERVIVAGGAEVEGGCVEGGSLVVLGGSLVGEKENSLSTEISGRILSDGWSVRRAWRFRGLRGSAHRIAVWNA